MTDLALPMNVLDFKGFEPGHLFSAVRDCFGVPERIAFTYAGPVDMARVSARWGGTGAPHSLRMSFWSDFVDEELYGQGIRRKRNALCMTLGELAVIAKTSAATVQRVEIGTRYAVEKLKRRLEVALKPPKARSKPQPVAKAKTKDPPAYRLHAGPKTMVPWIDAWTEAST